MKAQDVERRLEELAATSAKPDVPYALLNHVSKLEARPRPARRPGAAIIRFPARLGLIGVAAILMLAGALAVSGTRLSVQPPAPTPSRHATTPTLQPGGRSAAVFTVRVEGQSPSHWRLVAFDRFTGNGWELSAATTVGVAANGDLAAVTQNDLQSQPRIERRFTVTVLDPALRQVITTNEPASVSVDADVVTVGGAGSAQLAYATTDAQSYVVTALVPNRSSSLLTDNRLRTAAAPYPAGLLDLYTQGTDQVAADGRQLLDTILAGSHLAKPYTAYDVARAIETYLRDAAHGFTYDTDSAAIARQCGQISTVDCLARTKHGMAQQYATTMTMLLRLQGIPSRYAEGYLAGPPDPNTKLQTVLGYQLHAWVEVYFPGYGWLEFDPTPSVGVPFLIPPGPAAT